MWDWSAEESEAGLRGLAATPVNDLDGIDRVELPRCLERVARGIRLAGHRVSLFQVLDTLLDGISPERLKELFPTVPASQLAEVSAFCERHLDVLRGYHEKYRAAFATLARTQIGDAPSIEELRRRGAEKSGPSPRPD